MADPSVPLPHAFFRPRLLENLVIADELVSLDPIILRLDSKVMNLLLNSDTPLIFAECGRGSCRTFRTLRHGLEVEEFVSSDFPGIPNAVRTTKRTEDGTLVISYIFRFGKVSTVIATDVFGSIRSLAAFRLTGGTKAE
jgi:splicing factor 3B subunit 3